MLPSRIPPVVLLLPVLLAAAPLPARAGLGAAPFVDGVSLEALQGIQAQLRQIVQTPQAQRTPLLIPVVSLGDQRAARYRFRRRDEIFELEGGRRPVPVGWETSDVVETSGGAVERLLSVEDGVASGAGAAATLAGERRKAAGEDQRLAKLLGDDDAREKLQKKERSDEDGIERMINEFPRALQYRFEGVERDAGGEELVREAFESNDCSHAPHVDPCFTPRSQEARIFEGMKGMIWIRVRDRHLVRFTATIDHDVKFGWGIFSAKAKKGGTIAISLSDVDGSGRRWVISALEDHLTIEKSAMAALFSGGTERDNDHQAMSGFQSVPDMTFERGIELLRKEN
ncbi:MAG TPA: hypothetical protein VH309_08325 [Elusimicrobiota bacterium]|nr:hypothetical protein [Elusimicrobiota bacterium]